MEDWQGWGWRLVVWVEVHTIRSTARTWCGTSCNSTVLLGHKFTMWLEDKVPLPSLPLCASYHTVTLQVPSTIPPTRWGKARRCDLWHLNQGALKSLLNKTDGLGRLDWQGDWLTGPEAKRDPEAAALKCRRQHTGGGRGGGRVLAVTGLTD